MKLTVLGAPPAWIEAALCPQVDPEIFFPALGESAQPAKQVCRRCDALAECRADALADPTLEGVWGGMTVRERRKLRNHPDTTDQKDR